jgi:hypothetical protein
VGLQGAIVDDGRATATELSRSAELCGLLPLTLRIAGMFIEPAVISAEIQRPLADERRRFGRLKLEGSAALDVAEARGDSRQAASCGEASRSQA